MKDTEMPVEKMNEKYDALMRSIEEMQGSIQQGLTDGPAPAQAARLVALGLAKQAYSMLENVAGSLQCLRAPATDGGVENDHPLKELVSIAEEVLEELCEQYGVQKEAIAPFLYETTAAVLPIIETLVTKAQEKLREADELTQSKRSLAW